MQEKMTQFMCQYASCIDIAFARGIINSFAHKNPWWVENSGRRSFELDVPPNHELKFRNKFPYLKF